MSKEIDYLLVKLAAKAFGYVECKYEGWAEGQEWWAAFDGRVWHLWNPRDNDGHSFRLAVKTGVGIRYERNAPPELGLPRECAVATLGGQWFSEAPQGGDENAAMRRAVLVAAAEIGRNMK